MKVFLFTDTNFLGLYQKHWSTGSWISGFKHNRQLSMGKLYFVKIFNFFGLRQLGPHD